MMRCIALLVVVTILILVAPACDTADPDESTTRPHVATLEAYLEGIDPAARLLATAMRAETAVRADAATPLASGADACQDYLDEMGNALYDHFTASMDVEAVSDRLADDPDLVFNDQWVNAYLAAWAVYRETARAVTGVEPPPGGEGAHAAIVLEANLIVEAAYLVEEALHDLDWSKLEEADALLTGTPANLDLPRC